MQSPDTVQSTFQGSINRYNQVIINSKEQHCVNDFPGNLTKSLSKWKSDGLRSAWFNVYLDQADWVPHLAQNGFTFHHAKPDFVAMVRWLREDEPNMIPGYAHTLIGIGGIVMNDKRQILVVCEKHSFGGFSWKLPGGYVEPGEDFDAAVEREIFEETGVAATFRSLISLRHMHKVGFGCSDVYLVASLSLKAGNDELKPCPYEIKAVQWMDVNEFIEHPQVHIGNRTVVKKFLECEEHGVMIPANKSVHPTFKKALTTYHVKFGEPNQKGGKSTL